MAMSKSRISYSKVYDLNIRNIGTIKSRISCIFPKPIDRKSTRLNSSHDQISYAVFCLKKKIEIEENNNILELKEKINEIENISIQKRKLYLEKKILNNNLKLHNYEIIDFSTLFLSLTH